MKKLLLPFLLILVLIISACNSDTTKNKLEEADTPKSEPDTIMYESENGPIEVPANPKRVLVLSTYAGNVMALDVNLVGVDTYSKMNPRFESIISDVEEVTDDSLEKILRTLNPI